MSPTTQAWISLVGICLNLMGMLLLFRFALPYKNRTGGKDTMFPDDRGNENEKKLEQLYDIYSKLGLASAVIGTLLQAWIIAAQGALL